MRVLLFGATGMVGQGVLRECLRAPDVEFVQTVGRSATGQLDPRLHEITLPDMLDYQATEASLQGFDACFFCLGISSAGMTEDNYTRVTYDLTLAAAGTLSGSIRRWCSSMFRVPVPTALSRDAACGRE